MNNSGHQTTDQTNAQVYNAPDGLPGTNGITKDNNENEVCKKDKNVNAFSFGPPPKPFKKACYAWQIKNYQFTVEQMTESIKKEVAEMQLMRMPPHGVGDGSYTVNGMDINEIMCRGDHNCPLMIASGTARTMPTNGLPSNNGVQGRHGTSRAVRSVGQPANPRSPGRAMFGAADQENVNRSCLPALEQHNTIFNWHTRQLCRSIFDSTVNKMLEKIRYSMDERDESQAENNMHGSMIRPDSEHLSQDEIRQITMQNQALSAAIQRKYLMESEFPYDQVESVTSSEYDSSEDDGDESEGEDQEEMRRVQPMEDPPVNMDASLAVPIDMSNKRPSPQPDTWAKKPRHAVCPTDNYCEVRVSVDPATTGAKRPADGDRQEPAKKCRIQPPRDPEDMHVDSPASPTDDPTPNSQFKLDRSFGFSIKPRGVGFQKA